MLPIDYENICNISHYLSVISVFQRKVKLWKQYCYKYLSRTPLRPLLQLPITLVVVPNLQNKNNLKYLLCKGFMVCYSNTLAVLVTPQSLVNLL